MRGRLLILFVFTLLVLQNVVGLGWVNVNNDVDMTEGETGTFKVNGVCAGCTVSWYQTPATPAGKFSSLTGTQVTWTAPPINPDQTGITIRVWANDGSASLNVRRYIRNDYLSSYQFGHECMVIDTANCADVKSRKDVSAEGWIYGNYILSSGDLDISGSADVTGTITAANFFMSDGSQVGASTFVGKTTSSYTGSLSFTGGLVGYAAGNAICNSDYADSHMCTQTEMINTIAVKDISQITDWTGSGVWVSAGGPKYVPTNIPVDDCDGWRHGTAGSHLGNWWEFSASGGAGRAVHCGTSKQLACCK